MTTFPSAPLAAPVVSPAIRPDIAQSAAPVATELGSWSVTAPMAAQTLRHDPGPPADPAPLKGLGVPPLNTRQVGDFDKIDDPPPPSGIGLTERLAELQAAPQSTIDLRR